MNIHIYLNTLITISFCFFFTSCTREIDSAQLQERAGIFYAVNENKPFSGKVTYNSEKVINLKNGTLHGKTIVWYGWKSGRQVKSEFSYKNGLKNGKYTKWYKNGVKSETGYFKNDIEDGLWTYYYENGQKSNEVNFKNGEWNGKKLEWLENGQKYSEHYFVNGVLSGKCTKWYDNGIKSEEGNFKDGMEEGLWTFYYTNGQKSKEINFKNGKRDWNIKEWYVNGEKIEGTVTNLSYKIINSLMNKDLSEYSDCIITVDQIIQIHENHNNDKYIDRDRLKNDFKNINQQTFNSIISQAESYGIDWSGISIFGIEKSSYDSWRGMDVEGGRIDVQIDFESGNTYYEMKIDDCLLTNDGWKSLDGITGLYIYEDDEDW